MKKYLRIMTTCLLLFFLILASDNKQTLADTKKSATMIDLDRVTNHISFQFDMPKDGKIKLNINVQDRDTVPGVLKFVIQTGNSKDSEKIKEITGITSTNGVKDLEVELNRGKYYFYYELSNATGNFSDTVLALKCQAEILPTIPDNISELTVHSINSLDSITKEGYEEIHFGDEVQQKDLILPFTVDNAGGLLISLIQVDYGEDLEVGIYQDMECTKPVGEKVLMTDFETPKNIERTIADKGTYYARFTYEKENPIGLTTFKVKLYSISGEERTLSINKTTMTHQASDNDKIIYKLDIKSTKLLEFYITPYDNANGGSAYFRLLDKDKKKLTNKSFVVSDLNDERKYDPIIKYYTVNKGTYYLEIDANCSLYQLQSIAFDVDSKAGSSKSKAKLLKIRGNEAEGFFTTSTSTSKVDWYKFKVTNSSQYVDFTIAYKLDGEIEYEIINSKGKVLYNSSDETECREGYYYHWAGCNYGKGTYYIKVHKGSKSSSLEYAVILLKVI